MLEKGNKRQDLLSYRRLVLTYTIETGSETVRIEQRVGAAEM